MALLTILLFATFSLQTSLVQCTPANDGAAALVEFKASLHGGADNLSSWVQNTAPCNRSSWVGVSCDPFGISITVLNLSSLGLSGSLHHLSFESLPNLTTLDLSVNSFYGTIPASIGNLSKLAYLSLSFNDLSGNIPYEIGLLTKLTNLDMAENYLHGSIPHHIGRLTSLTNLQLFQNNLSGSIPISIGNLTKLKYFSLSRNQLSGSIPSQIKSLNNLEFLHLYRNRLSGSIPSEIGNLQNLQFLALLNNMFNGSIPASMGKLTKLSILYLWGNLFSGLIPSEIGNLQNLEVLHLEENMFNGSIPASMGKLTKLTHLDLSQNNLSGQIPSEIGKLILLTNLTLFSNKLDGFLPSEMNNLVNLKVLQLSDNNLQGVVPSNICQGRLLQYLSLRNNNFTGQIPASLKNCTSLVRVRLEDNRLEGDIFEIFGIHPHLNYMDLSHNQFHGELSSLRWSQLQNLTHLNISRNHISGQIPADMANATGLQRLDFSSNQIVGEIPRELGGLSNLFHLSLSDNHLSGELPATLGILSHLEHLNVGRNNLNGSIPKEIGKCSRLSTLNLNGNRFIGGIPPEMGSLQSLEDLDMSNNLLSGSIPRQLKNMLRLQYLNLSHNMLFGPILTTFEDMFSLTTVDLSFNELAGPIPNIKAFREASFEQLRDNKGLCGNATGLKPCAARPTGKSNLKSRRLLIEMILAILGGLLFVMLLIVALKRLRASPRRKGGHQDSTVNTTFAICGEGGEELYDKIVEATNGFSSEYCIGEGGQATIYKAILQDGLTVSAKKFESFQDGGSIDLKAFKSEIRALTSIKHRNIVKLYGFYSHGDHSLLVYQFIERGSLRNALSSQGSELNWVARMNLVKSVADALTYMHHDCSPPIIHRDISSNNVLLDSEYGAHVSDFGTARFLKTDTSSYMTSPMGTFGYMAPELAYAWKLSGKSDVYSFGVLALEILIGQHPSELLSALFSPPSSKPVGEETLLCEVLDQRIPPPKDRVAEKVVLTANLALACVNADPLSRPTMRQVSSALLRPCPSLHDAFSIITVGELLQQRIAMSPTGQRDFDI